MAGLGWSLLGSGPGACVRAQMLREQPCVLALDLGGSQYQSAHCTGHWDSVLPHQQVTVSDPDSVPAWPALNRKVPLHTWISPYRQAHPQHTRTGSPPPALQPGTPGQRGRGLGDGLSAVSGEEEE